MRRTINSAGQAAYDSDAAIAQFRSQTLGDLAGIRRARARPHDGDAERLEQTGPANDPEDRWGVVNRRQTTGVVPTAERDRTEATVLRQLQPALSAPLGSTELPAKIGGPVAHPLRQYLR